MVAPRRRTTENRDASRTIKVVIKLTVSFYRKSELQLFIEVLRNSCTSIFMFAVMSDDNMREKEKHAREDEIINLSIELSALARLNIFVRRSTPLV